MRRCLIVSCWLACAHAGAINLDKLSNCADLNTAVNALRGAYSALGGACREPATALERQLARKLGPAYGKQACFVRRVPLRGLAGYSCIKSNFAPGYPALTCFTEASSAQLDHYKAEFTTAYQARVLAYLNQAQTCPIAQKDAAQVGINLAPPLINLLAKHDFGYLLKMKVPEPAAATALHGYARIDNARLTWLPGAIEYVNVALFEDGAAKVPSGRIDSVGPWRIDVDKEYAREMTKAAAQHGAPLLVDGLGVDITRRGGPPRSEQDKLQMLKRLLAGLRRSLEDEGFSDEEFGAHRRLSPGALRDRMSRNLAPGLRERVGPRMGELHLLVKSGAPACAAGEGRLAAGLSLIAPVPDMTDEYGGLFVVVFGVGECDRNDSSARRYVSAVSRQLEADFRQLMEKER